MIEIRISAGRMGRRMTWMIQITFEEWRALGGLGNPELRRTVNAIGTYSYFKPGE